MLELLRWFYCFIHFIRIFLTFVKSMVFFCCIIYLCILNKIHCLVITDIDSDVCFMEVFSVSSSSVNSTLTCLFLGNQLFRVILFSVLCFMIERQDWTLYCRDISVIMSYEQLCHYQWRLVFLRQLAAGGLRECVVVASGMGSCECTCSCLISLRKVVFNVCYCASMLQCILISS